MIVMSLKLTLPLFSLLRIPLKSLIISNLLECNKSWEKSVKSGVKSVKSVQKV